MYTDGFGMILIDTREQKVDYITDMFDRNGGIRWQICTFPQNTGCDYLITGDGGSVGIQRKTSNEIIREMKEIREDVLPRLMDFTDNPVLLVEENHHINQHGWIMRREGDFLRETGLIASAYYNFLSSVRNMGVDVVCTRCLDHSIWWMMSTYEYLKIERYPKPRSKYTHHARALGMLCCINGIGQKRGTEILKDYTIAELIHMEPSDLRKILNENQIGNFIDVLRTKGESV